MDIIRSSDQRVRQHIRRYYDLLQAHQEIKLSQLESSYRQMAPSLHAHLNQPQIDLPVLNYSLTRLPDELFFAQKIILAPSINDLKAIGLEYANVTETYSPKRRRRCYFHSDSGTLICLITSDSDIDDIVNMLIAFQIERNKITTNLKEKIEVFISKPDPNRLHMSDSHWHRLRHLLGDNWQDKLRTCTQLLDLTILLTNSGKEYYLKSAQNWLSEIVTKSFIFDLTSVPLYFVSSNLHALTNIIGGFALQKQNDIFNFLEQADPVLYRDWLKIKEDPNVLRVNDFLYYVSALYFRSHPEIQKQKLDYENSLGIREITVQSELSASAQLIPISAFVASNHLDPFLKVQNKAKLANSNAYILNVDYPLGLSAHYLLSQVLSIFFRIKSIHIVGKAAILSGEVGDVQIPKIIFDERSNNIFEIDNCFNQNFPATSLQCDVLHDQKAISVFGTFLENKSQIDNYLESGFNIIEMESGPYLSAVSSHINNGLQESTIHRLNHLPFDLGIINYASDNPLTKNLGEGDLALKGVEPTYLSLLAVAQRIIDLESTSP